MTSKSIHSPFQEVHDRIIEIANLYEELTWPTSHHYCAFFIEGDRVRIINHLGRTDGYSEFHFPLEWVWDSEWEQVVRANRAIWKDEIKKKHLKS